MGFGPSPNSWTIRSLKGTHFTGALATDAFELENLGPLPASAAIITRVTVWSDENLDWDVFFFNDAANAPDQADLDQDSMVDWIRFTAADGVRIAAAGPYRYSVSGLNLRYDPLDGQAHVMLVNRSVASKTAGATGEVVIELQGPVL